MTIVPILVLLTSGVYPPAFLFILFFAFLSATRQVNPLDLVYDDWRGHLTKNVNGSEALLARYLLGRKGRMDERIKSRWRL